LFYAIDPSTGANLQDEFIFKSHQAHLPTSETTRKQNFIYALRFEIEESSDYIESIL